MRIKSKRLLVSPEDDRDRGWYTCFVAAPTSGLVGEENMSFPEKWNFAPTMEVFEEILDFCAWVEKLIYVAPMERRSWKYLSRRFGWKVKTHGFVIRGVSPASVSSARLTVSLAQETIPRSFSKRKVDGACGSEEEEEELEEGSLVRGPRVRRRVISDDEAILSPSSIPVNEPADATLVNSNEEMNAPPRESTDKLFSRGFDSGDFGPIFEELPFASLPVSVPVCSQSTVPITAATAPSVAAFTSSTIPISTTSHVEVGTSNSNRVMKKVTIKSLKMVIC